MTALELNLDFKLKGSSLRNLKAYLDQRLGKGFFEKAAHKFELERSGIVLNSSWYAFDKVRMIYDLAADELGIPSIQLVYDISIHQMEVDLTGVYKFFIKVGGPQASLKRVPQLTKTYTNFIFAKVLISEPGLTQFEFQVPTAHVDWYLNGIRGSFEGLLNVCQSPINTYRIIDRSTDTINGHDYTMAIVEVTY